MSSVVHLDLEKPAYSVVLVNYKTRELTEICLKLLYKAFKGTGVQVWVVDNDSADESTEFLRSLDWIHFVERKPVANEPGFMAHGCALDMVLERVNTDYLYLLHTDTLIHDPEVFDIMLNECKHQKNVAAVGCVDQIYRGQVRIVWRFVSRFLKHYMRRLKLRIGFSSKQPKPYYEVHLKSFCALWNIKLMKEKGLTFALNNKIPGYEAQDRLIEQGYKISYLSARKMFKYMDHVEAATVSAQGGYDESHRRTKKYNAILEKMNKI